MICGFFIKEVFNFILIGDFLLGVFGVFGCLLSDFIVKLLLMMIFKFLCYIFGFFEK